MPEQSEQNADAEQGAAEPGAAENGAAAKGATEMPPGAAEDDLGYSLRRKILIFSKIISQFFATPLLRMR